MSSLSDSDEMETNLDEVEIDEYGNIRKSQELYPPRMAESESLDDMETDLDAVDVDAVDVDEDGNLRIHSAEKLLDTTFSSSCSQTGARNSDLTPEEKQSSWRRQNDKQQYAGAGTDEERKEMLAVESRDGVDSAPGPSFRATAHDSDPNKIELSVLGQPSREHHPAVTGWMDVEGNQEEREPVPKGRPLGILVIIYRAVRNFFSNLTPTRWAILIALIAIIIGFGLLVSLLPASFVYIEYHELALAKNRITGKVNRRDVYYPGCYLLTPETELIRFQGTAHHLLLDFEVQTSDELTFSIQLSLYYFIKPEELGLLFTNFEFNYRDVIEKVVRSTVKNQAGKFSLDNFRLNRTLVARDFEQAVAKRLSGNCCPSCCPNNCGKAVDCRYSCRLVGRCSYGFHMELRYFQMLGIAPPDEVLERFLRQAVLLIEGEKEMFIQEHAVETKVSEMEKNQILNQANEIREAGVAEAKKIVTLAEADYEKTVQTSYAQALKKFYQRLNVTLEDHKLSLMYIRALEDISDNLYSLNFDRLSFSG